MDPIIQSLNNFNDFLDQFYLFRAYKFVVAFYMLIIVFTVSAIGYRVGKIYYTVFIAGQSMPHIPKGRFQSRWDAIVARLDSFNESDWKIAVIESAQMLNEVLETLKYEGDALGNKLESMFPAQLANLTEAKEANKIKNKVVNDPDFHISKEEATRTVEVFGNSLHFFEVID